MTDELRIWQADAFTGELFRGNPAAVCLVEADWPEDEVLRQIADENNLSETAFLRPAGGDYELRWFTPRVEVALCGHATLASALVVTSELEPGRTAVRFATRHAGLLTVEARGGGAFAMDFPAIAVRPAAAPPELAAALGVAPRALSIAPGSAGGEPERWLARLEDERAVAALSPDLRLVAALPADRLIVTAAGGEVDFVSRYFAPRAGVDEDPVTGSAHCLLAPYWAAELGRTTLRARQLSRRGGELLCSLRGERVELTGEARLYLRGTIRLR